MIQFNGIQMDGAANVRLTDIVVSPMQVRETVRERTLRSGADFVRVTGGTRTVTVSCSTRTGRAGRKRCWPSTPGPAATPPGGLCCMTTRGAT